MNKKKNKQLIAGVLAAALLVSGTYAWQSFSQRVTNETAGFDADQGTRLHNYFNGSNADVFVENYSTAESGVTAYTRVKVLEYMEIGENAGKLDGGNTGTTLVRGDVENYLTPDINDKTTWDTYLHQDNAGATTGDIREYLKVKYGDINNANSGSTVYMPTFNKNFDDLNAEINGTLLGSGTDRFESSTYYDDYQEYTVGEIISGTASYNADAVIAKTTGTTEIEEEHEADNTLTGYVTTMDAWISGDMEAGDFWVYDIDGWAYWANGLAPETATSLLIDSISRVKTPDENWYYGLHVINDSATASTWVEQMMMDDGADVALSDNAVLLLSSMGVEVPELEFYDVTFVTPAGGLITDGSSYTETIVGGSISLVGSVNNSYGSSKYQDVDWSIEEVDTSSFSLGSLFSTGNASGLSDEAIDGTLVDGVFTPITGMEGCSYEITAESTLGDVSTSIVLSVLDTTVEAGVTINSVTILSATGAYLTDAQKEITEGASLTMTTAVSTTQGNDTYQNVEWTISSTATNLTQDQLDATLVGSVFTSRDGMGGNTYTITATSIYDKTVSNSVDITVKAIEVPAGVTITGVDVLTTAGATPSETYRTTSVGSSITLTSKVYASANEDDYQDVNWSIAGPTSTTVSTTIRNATLVDGVFTPVSGMEGNSYTVTATSAYDDDISAEVTLIVESAPPETMEVSSVAIRTAGGNNLSESDKELFVGDSNSYIAVVYTNEGFTDYQGVNWTITAPSGCNILTSVVNATLSNGIFSPTDGMEGYTYTITATSAYDDTKFDTVDVTVKKSVDDIIKDLEEDAEPLVITKAYIRNANTGLFLTTNQKATAVGSSVPMTTEVATNYGTDQYQEVNWSITSTDCSLSQGVINATLVDGTFTPVSGMEGCSFTVTVQSVYDTDTTKAATEVLTVAEVAEVLESIVITTATAGIPSEAYKTVTEDNGSITFAVTIYTNLGYKEYQEATWSIVEKGQTTTTSAINATMANGTFTPVTGMGGKTYTITATISGKLDSVDVTVEEKGITGFYLRQEDGTSSTTTAYSTIYEGESQVYTVETQGYYGAPAIDFDEWTFKLREYYTSAANSSGLSDEVLQKAISVDKTNRTISVTMQEGMGGYRFYLWACGPDFDHNVVYSNSSNSEPTGSTNLSPYTHTISNLINGLSESSSITIALDSSYADITEAEQGAFIGFGTPTVSGYNGTSYVNWWVEGNESSNTKAGLWGLSNYTKGGLWIGADEPIGNILRVYATSQGSSSLVSNVLEFEVVKAKDGVTIVEIPGAVGSAVVGGESTVMIDGYSFYALALNDEEDEVLLWASANVSSSRYFNTETGLPTWEDSYLRTVTIPYFLESLAPTVNAYAVEKELETDGYYSSTNHTQGDGTIDSEYTKDRVFILNGKDVDKYVGFNGPLAPTSAYYWMRSWTSSNVVGVMAYTGTGMSYVGLSTHSWGFRPAFWISL